jgi:predicted Holliday junction resolvase-like endonuclease
VATQDFSALAVQAKAKAAERARIEAAMERERKRLAEEEVRRKAALKAELQRLAREEAELKARIEADRRQRIAAARTSLLDKAEADLQPLVPLFTGPMSPATKTAMPTCEGTAPRGSPWMAPRNQSPFPVWYR